MRFDSFMRFLNEEITSNGKPLSADDPVATGGKKKKKDEVPDFAADADMDNDDPANADPNEQLPDPTSVPQDDPTQQQQQTPDAGAEDPTQQQGADQQQTDPIAGGGAEGEQDPNMGGDAGAVEGDPNAQGDEQQQDPNAEDPNAAGMEDPTATGDGSQGPDMQQDEIKELEDSLFKNLKPDQIKSAKINLKGQFVDLYEIIDKTIERLNKIDRTSADISAINFVVKKLFEVRTLLKEALIKNFDNKSYVENQIILQRHMAIFNALTNIMGELGKTKSAKDKKRAKRIMSGKEEDKNEKGELDGGSNDKEKKQTTDEDELKI